MKQKKFRFAKWTLFMFMVIICAISILVRNTKYAILDPASRNIDDNTKKILFHIFGVKNMTAEEKKEVLKESNDFTKRYKGEIDSILNKVFPDQKTAYSIDSNFIISFHLTNGNPEIYVGFLDSCKSYFYNEEIFLSPYDYYGNLKEVDVNSYLAELSHSKQFYTEPFSFAYRNIKWNIKRFVLRTITNCSPQFINDLEYRTKGTVENEAHHVIEPKLIKDYLDYRCLYFKDEINEAEKKLSEAAIKFQKKEAVTAQPSLKAVAGAAKYRLKLWQLQSAKDSLVYGPLYH